MSSIFLKKIYLLLFSIYWNAFFDLFFLHFLCSCVIIIVNMLLYFIILGDSIGKNVEAQALCGLSSNEVKALTVYCGYVRDILFYFGERI